MVALDEKLLEESKKKDAAKKSYHVLVPEIFRVVFAIFIAHVIEDTFDFMFLFILRVRIGSNVIASLRIIFEFIEIIDVIYVVRDLHTAARDAKAIIRDARLFLFL